MLLCCTVLLIVEFLKVEYHANAKYENPLQISEINNMCCSKVNVSNNE